MGLESELARMITLFSSGDGIHDSPLAGTHCIKISHPCRRSKQYWGASLCIVAQGCKEITLGREVYRCDGAHYIAAPLDLPITSRILSATSEHPFLCLKIDFDTSTMSEVAAQIETNFPKETENPLRAMFIGEASDQMLDAALRLGRLLQVPEDAVVLGPLVIREILYHLLKGADGPAIRQFVRSMSPIQYQKRLRLLEARRLMIDGGETAECSAFKVGYKSASQFSREYSRMFGHAPLRDTMKTRTRGGLIHQI
jgi:hypothetical protein